MAKKKQFEGEILVRFKVKQTDGPMPEHLEDLHRWLEEEWDGTEVYFQGDEEKEDETVVELEVVGFEDLSQA